MSAQDYATWFQETPCRFLDPTRLVLTVPNRFRRAWLEKSFGDTVRSCVIDLFGPETRVEFLVEGGSIEGGSIESRGDPSRREGSTGLLSDTWARSSDPLATAQRRGVPTTIDRGADWNPMPETGTDAWSRAPQARAPESPPPVPSLVRPKLNREYTFETFIVGSSNRVAHAAALAVSESPGKAYNPLSLYGSSGVGKTHLLQAICHRIVTTTRLRVSCATAESVLEDVSASIDGSSVFPDNSRLLDFDVIAIDDLEFTTSRERIQQAFFRFLELAIEKRIQLIVSSPVHPRSVQGLLPRFSSRFGWGLALELETPGLEGRVAILVRKAHQRQHDLPVEVAESLAARVSGSIRELEGTLLRLLSYASFTGAPLSLDTARLALRELFDEPQAAPGVTLGRILSTVQEHYKIKPRELLARSKARGVVLPRQVAMYLARQHTQLSLEEIGLHFGGRDHTTVLYAEERMTKLLRDDPEIRATLQVIESRLFARHRYGS